MYVDDVAPDITFDVVQVTPPEPDVVYHLYEYVDVPPDGLAVKVILCPESIVGLDGVTAPADNAEFTITLLFTLFTVTGVVALSVTNTQ